MDENGKRVHDPAGAAQREATADTVDATADAREAAADTREAAAETREATADAREATADTRDATADSRDATADARDTRADQREATTDTRDVTADKREATADRRETKADKREATADTREVDNLRRANQELIRLDNLKSEFVAMASHELRTPLTSIAGFSSTMMDKWQTLSEADKYKFVGIIDGQSQRLSRLVEDLLTFSKIESGALKTNPSTFDVRSAVNQTIEYLDVENVEVACAENLMVVADRDHFQQIIVIYISNAINHGAAPIKVEVDSENDSVRIRVTDQGDGVPELFVPHLFERFTQADPDNSRSSDNGKGKGTGLGLSIAYALAKAQGGEAWYEPDAPTGSCFSVRLPRKIIA